MKMSDAVRFLSADMVEQAASGHPGAPMGLAEVATVLWTRFLKFDPSCPSWPDRDRFVLSNGHASALLYSLFYLTGYQGMSLQELKRFRQKGSKTAGHPEHTLYEGIEATTGPLGQGFAMAVGMALAERLLSEKFSSKLVNHKTYVIVGDGDLMEGISQEAIELAGRWGLSKLIALWDDNGMTIDGPTTLVSCTDQKRRFESAGWQVLSCDGHNNTSIEKALTQAQKATRPTLICCRTIIGKGAPTKAGTNKAHGSPLGAEELSAAKKAVGWPQKAFAVPKDILQMWRKMGSHKERIAWEKRLSASSQKKAFLETQTRGARIDLTQLKRRWVNEKPNQATRLLSQQVLDVIVPACPRLLGGAADLSASVLTKAKDSMVINPPSWKGNYLEYGVREFAMAAIMNGLSLHKGFIPYGGTFFVFSDYLKPALRLSALMKQAPIFVLTHDSIGVGQDGPTHQPIEQLAGLRAMPNVLVIRPADSIETAESWEVALEQTQRPTCLVLSRQKLPTLRTEIRQNKVSLGAYVLSGENKKRQATLLATGSEVSLALQAQAQLAKQKIDVAVVSMPCWELFAEQSPSYQKKVLSTAPILAIEAGSAFGWHRWADDTLCIDTFGQSAPEKELYETYGLTVKNIVQKVKRLIKEKK